MQSISVQQKLHYSWRNLS